jgi:hypothetical protein
MNEYDMAGRFVVKQAPLAQVRWLLGHSTLRFRAWIDSRRVALPEQGDLTNDLVAAVEAVTLPGAAGRRPVWQRALRDWNMNSSSLLGKAEAKGRAEATRDTLFLLGRTKFGKAPTRRQQQKLEATTDIARLAKLTARVLTADSWEELLNGD